MDGDNDSPLPSEVDNDGYCPGYRTSDGICGVYKGWTPDAIVDYVNNALEDDDNE